MSLIKSAKLVIAPPNPAGYPFIIAGGALALLGKFIIPGKVGRICFNGGIFFAGFCLYFFRDPERFPPAISKAIVAPADGRVISVEKVLPPPELNLGKVPRWRVAIFLSVLDVHINRMPAAGKVVQTVYHPGQFLNASLDKTAETNERNSITLQLDSGAKLGVVQIAGLIARRIVCEAQKNMRYEKGERFGLIRFGSRTDLYLPEGAIPLVSKGQRMTGGETIIAHS
ncbi:phosphatidylserine decarboxylase [Entomobacter blattae]|uniref:Phosphatidylserine decarboxylase proenzyme n=1 Tax=Entomobacter blattae TaxID=2762277 RepID=A0A7H1NUZ4_9PROT|nr:phosphatidylserine decarboxylase [Entomobacter blattae]QNT79604.1 Phosphatidylserine decarboxylase proenzyme [Entomobacter blattae]